MPHGLTPTGQGRLYLRLIAFKECDYGAFRCYPRLLPGFTGL